MLNLSTATRIFVALEPVDLRQSFNGLHALVQRVLQQDPLSGHLFVFTNRIRTRLKLLVWDGSGLCNPSTENPQYRIRAQAALLSVAPLVWS